MLCHVKHKGSQVLYRRVTCTPSSYRREWLFRLFTRSVAAPYWWAEECEPPLTRAVYLLLMQICSLVTSKLKRGGDESSPTQQRQAFFFSRVGERLSGSWNLEQQLSFSWQDSDSASLGLNRERVGGRARTRVFKTRLGSKSFEDIVFFILPLRMQIASFCPVLCVNNLC